jgi:glycosyltransferase involved in cell wall biosynthesis
MSKRILFLVPYPLHESPSQRFRFEQYFEILRNNGHRYTVQNFLNSDNWGVFFKSGNTLVKLATLIAGFTKRVIVLVKSPMYDFVFIHREAAPLGPPIFEWIIAKVLRRKIIYDFDDAIWLTDRQHESLLFRIAKWRSKVGTICKWAYKVSGGNEYLCDYAARFNERVVYNPTTIDTENLHRRVANPVPDQESPKIRIGWTGSHSTLKYLDDIQPVLREILRKYPAAQFIVIADRPPSLDVGLAVKFTPWRRETEINDLLQVDIGIMPLPDDQWAKGKCGFKALQYMALELPAVASPVGVNSKIINHGVNGFLCSTPEEWEETLRMLIEDCSLRKRMGKNGRRTVVENYSVLSNSSNFLSLFE